MCAILGIMKKKNWCVLKSSENLSRCSFIIVTSDGSLQHIEISREPNASVNNGLILKGKLLQNVCGIEYHPELSLLVVVTSSDTGNFFYFLFN